MDQIQISLNEVLNTATQIRACNVRLMEELNQIKIVMNQLSNTWSSPAAESVRQKFNGMSILFENYKDVIDAYAKFLEISVSSYETTEKLLQSDINSFL